MNSIHKDRLLKLAEFLKDIPEKHFDMNVISKGRYYEKELEDDFKYIHKTKREKYDCDSAACAIGWSPICFPQELKYYWDSHVNQNGIRYINDEKQKQCCENRTDSGIITSWKIAEDFFGLNEYEADYLFSPEEYMIHDEEHSIYDKIPKQRVIDRIIDFVNKS